MWLKNFFIARQNTEPTRQSYKNVEINAPNVEDTQYISEF